MYRNIKEFSDLRFSTCEGCLDDCCSSSRFVMAPLILEDIPLVYRYFPIYFASIDNRLRLVMIMSGKEPHCPYLKEGKCAIYSERPPTCRLYPISPFYDEVLVDTSCRAVGNEGSVMITQGRLADDFYHERLANFGEKLAQTEAFIAECADSLTFSDEIAGIKLFDCENEEGEILELIRRSKTDAP